MFFNKKHRKIDFLDTARKVDDLIHFTKKKKKNIFLRIVKYFLFFLLFLFILAIVLSAVLFLRFKGVYELVISGKSSLEYSMEAAKRKDFDQMLDNSRRAEKYFNDILLEIENLKDNLLIKNFEVTKEQLAEAEYLIKSASVISRSVEQIAAIAKELDNVLDGKLGTSFSQFSSEEKEKLLKLIYESNPDLNGVKASLNLALMNLDKVEANSFVFPVQNNIKKIRDQLSLVVESLFKTVLTSQILPELAGYPDKSTFLVLFQNNTELRPTGGFIGTYGILEVKNGDIIRFDTHDIYHMDMPMEANKSLQIVPPEPIAKYLNKNWYMRDSNWSPDWPTSARRINWFYNKENDLLPEENKINNFSGEFDGVIGITPDLVASLLEVVGPINMGGEEFNEDNFVEILQYKVEQDYTNQNVSSWERKEIISEILEELKIRLFDLHYSRWLEVAEKINNNVQQKNILLFLKDEHLQSLIMDIGVAGELKEAERDYFMVVDANMAALKTDAVMNKSIKYTLEQRQDGLFAHLRINYVHEGEYNWKTSDYKTYTRVYVPLGSQLINVEGTESEVEEGEELDKTFFGTFFSVKAGRSGSLYFEYKLPKDLEECIEGDKYELYVQKQPGNNIKNLELDVSLLNDVRSYSPYGLNLGGELLNDNRVRWVTDLETDKEFKINFN